MDAEDNNIKNFIKIGTKLIYKKYGFESTVTDIKDVVDFIVPGYDHAVKTMYCIDKLWKDLEEIKEKYYIAV